MICEREEEIARFKAREYWTVDADAEKANRRFPARLIEYRGEKVEQFTVTSERAGRAMCAPQSTALRAASSVSLRSKEAAPPQSGAAVHDVDAATGSRAQARLRRAAHDASGAAAVRRRRLRRRRRRSDHVHAHGLGESRQRGRAARSARSSTRTYGQESLPEDAARVQDQVEERAGSARGGSPDLRGDHAGATSKARSTPTSSSCTA